MKIMKCVIFILCILLSTIAFAGADSEKLKLEIEKLKLENEGLRLRNQNSKSNQNNEIKTTEIPNDLKECLYKDFKKCRGVANSYQRANGRLENYKHFDLLMNTLENACAKNNYDACGEYGDLLYFSLRSDKSIPIYEKLCVKERGGCSYLIKIYLKEGPVKAKISIEEGLKKAKEIASKCSKKDSFYLCSMAGIYLRKYDKGLGKKYSEIALTYKDDHKDNEELELTDILKISKSCEIELEVQDRVTHAHLGVNPYAKFYVNVKNKNEFRIDSFQVLFSLELNKKRYDHENFVGKALSNNSFKTEQLVALEDKHVVNEGDRINFISIKPVSIRFDEAKMDTEFSDRLIDFCEFKIKYAPNL